jgi:MoaA/NifB/PqqE/SkfB family radical SAM enzyme
VVEAIRGSLSRGAKVVLSGGEPTLNPRLSEYVRLATGDGSTPMQLQTNAVRFDDPALVRTLFEAGLREAFVSLHAASPEVSDALTGAPGTFVRTLTGIDNLVRAGVDVITNFVISEPNAAEFPRYVALVAGRWPRSTINVSFVAPSTDVVPRELVPRYSAILPHLVEGLQLAEQAKLAVRGFESMCGIPLCVVPDRMERYFALAAVSEDEGRGEFIRTPACDACSARERCFGVRRGYADLHGVDELRPLP